MRLSQIKRGDIVSWSGQLWRVNSAGTTEAQLWNVFTDATAFVHDLVFVGADSLSPWADMCLKGPFLGLNTLIPPPPSKRTKKGKEKAAPSPKVDRIETKDIIKQEVARPVKRQNSVVDGTDGDDFVPEPISPRQPKW